jgi:hypothetical protein
MKLNIHTKGQQIKLFGIGLLFVTFLLGISAYANAQTSTQNSTVPGAASQNDFVLEPGKMEIFVNPGDNLTRTITVTNRVSTPVKFKIETEDFKGSTDPDMAVVLMGSEKGPNSFKDNLVPEVTEFTLGPGEKINVPIKISIPLTAQPGGFYASVLVSNKPSIDETNAATDQVQGKTTIVSRVGVLFFIRVNGPVEEKGFVEDFYMKNRQALFSKGPYTFEISFQNDGTVHLVPYGLITIKNLFGNNIGSLPVDAYFALPKSIRYREVEWTNSPFLFGRYTATADIHLGYGTGVDSKTVAFWVIPWKFVIIVLISLLVIISLAYVFFNKFELHRK